MYQFVLSHQNFLVWRKVEDEEEEAEARTLFDYLINLIVSSCHINEKHRTKERVRRPPIDHR